MLLYMCTCYTCVHVDVHVYMCMCVHVYMLSTYSFLNPIVSNLPSRIETNLVPAWTNEVQIKICKGGSEGGEGRERREGERRKKSAT